MDFPSKANAVDVLSIERIKEQVAEGECAWKYTPRSNIRLLL